MITAIRPYNPQNTQRQNFCAVNPEFFQRAEKAVKNGFGFLDVTENLQYKYGFDEISKEDTLDTLGAFKGIFPKDSQNIIDDAIEWVNNFNR